MSSKPIDETRYKKLAGEAAADHLASGMVVGLGHGSTAVWAIRRLAELLWDGKLENIWAIPCSKQVESLAHSLRIPLTTLAEHPVIDLTIDGADEVDPRLNLIKGAGGALLHEKIIAQASRRELIVVDAGKLVPVLGSRGPLPVEVVPFGLRTQAEFLAGLGAKVALRENEAGDPYVSDEGNHIFDCDFGAIHDPARLAARLDGRAGIVGHGLFLGLASEVIVAGPAGIERIAPPDAP